MDSEKQWRIEDDLHALQRAEEVKRDKSRLKDAQDLEASKMEDLQKIKRQPIEPPLPIIKGKQRNSRFNFDGVS